MRGTDGINHGARGRVRAILDLDDERDSRVAFEDLGERGHALPSPAPGAAFVLGKAISGVHACELIRGPARDRSRGVGAPIEIRVMVHDRHAVTREVHVELEPVCAGREPEIEGRTGILRAERAAAAMREHERAHVSIDG